MYASSSKGHRCLFYPQPLDLCSQKRALPPSDWLCPVSCSGVTSPLFEAGYWVALIRRQPNHRCQEVSSMAQSPTHVPQIPTNSQVSSLVTAASLGDVEEHCLFSATKACSRLVHCVLPSGFRCDVSARPDLGHNRPRLTVGRFKLILHREELDCLPVPPDARGVRSRRNSERQRASDADAVRRRTDG